MSAMVNAGRKKVLVIEDDVALAELYRGVLRVSGFHASHVTDGFSALRFLEEELPDLIVVDMNLPVLNGDEVLREMAARPDLRQIPAIVVTGEDIRPDVAVEQAKQILRKPCPPDRLVSAVERYVRAA
jgi:CheY-like chemotaxis protein